MLTEEAREDLLVERTKKAITLCEEAVAKSEKYERLKDFKPWQDYLGDLKILIDVHDREIKFGLQMLAEAPHTTYVRHATDGSGKEQVVSSKMDWVDFIVRHQIQKEEASNWMTEPDRILELARQAREQVPLLKEKLVGLTHEGNNAEH